ncbi:MAG TPA: family 16 glycosylhydrolase [Tepidisphaeraceae bacterium]|jgi:beta-glucanase (GH16 family)|nr:family 16 glycosylhydrolase [Tepidisphaeraceae bacterium]
MKDALLLLLVAVAWSMYFFSSTAAGAAGPVGPSVEGLVLWLDAADRATLEIDDQDRVRSWRSKTASHVTLKSGADPDSRPVFAKDAINKLPAVRFPGHQHLTASRDLRAAKGPVTAFVVYQRKADQVGEQQWQRLVSARIEGEAADNQPPNFILLAETDGQPLAVPPTITHSEAANVALGKVTIGASTEGGNWFAGDVAEVLLYERAFLSYGDQRSVIDYLQTKWKAHIHEVGWTRVGELGPTPEHKRQDLPLSDQANRGKWTLDQTFSDEFNAPELDMKRWHVNPVDHDNDWMGREPAMFTTTNVVQREGMLQLTFRKETVPLMKAWKGYADYTSAFIRTRGRTGYGYYETRIRPMSSAGSSSFWFTNTGIDDQKIEIDVFEIGAKAKGFERKYNMTAHVWRTPESDRHWAVGGVWEAPWNLDHDFHVYGFEWNADELTWYVDGVVVRRMRNTNWFLPMWMIYDSEAMWDWFGQVDDADLPSTYYIDYIRVWRSE